jgi:4'-phosphopantetheinyl transferase
MSRIFCQYLNNPKWIYQNQDKTDFDTEIRVHGCFIPNYVKNIHAYYEVLNEAERKRANKYHQQKDKQRFIIARGLLKKTASLYLGVPVPEIQINVGANKKPFISSSSILKLEYNLSHAGNWIIMAFGLGTIGIDVEQMQADFNYESLLPVCFSSLEQDYIQNKPNSRELFYRLWTRKESFVKATSKGLDDNLPFLTCLEGEGALLDQFNDGRSWEIWSFPLDQDHVASISFADRKKNILFIQQDI